jgi:fluoride ion exporter CrcB/FEX
VADCPVATRDSAGVLQQNQLLVNLTGAEALRCGPTTGPCGFIGFRFLADGVLTTQSTISVESTSLGQERARIGITGVTGGSCYGLSARVFGSLQITPNQNVPICLDPAN